MLREFEKVAPARPGWLEQPERGSPAAMRLALWLMLKLGRRLGRMLLFPILAYFLLFAPRARRASASYLRRALGRRATLADVARHFHAFASTMQDQFYLLAGKHGEFEVTLEAPAQAQSLMRRKGGCILLGSHLGSFEILRARGMAEGLPPVNMLMYLENAEKSGRLLRTLAPELESRIIPLGRPDALLRVHECLARGELVGMLGDRAWRNERSCSLDFLGAPARFPLGPLLVAGLLRAPVVLFFGLYVGRGRYEIRLEPFADAIALDPHDRDASVRPWVERYARRLEHHCRLTPYNWFNFYDFWA
jgi:predicted LPLAT superfamily acyltransferase